MHSFRFDTDDGFPLAVQTDGPVDAPAMLLLPGQANAHRWWDGLRESFEEEFRTITFDYRGTGESRGPVERWTTSSFADDAASVLDAVGVDSAAVFGTSMGGRVAQLLAANHADRVDSLVLACTSPGGPLAVERPREVRQALARATPTERPTLLRDLFYTPAWPHAPSESHLLGDTTMTPEETAAHLRVSYHHDAWNLLPDVVAPTLVLHGTDDRMTPADNAPLLAQRIPGAVLHLTTGARHGFFDEFSDDVLPLVRDFVS